MFLMLSLNGLSISSARLLIALLDVCSSDTITAEYDVVTNSDSMRVNRKTIRDDRISGDRDVPVEQKGTFLLAAWLHSKLVTAAFWLHSKLVTAAFWLHSKLVTAAFWLHSNW